MNSAGLVSYASTLVDVGVNAIVNGVSFKKVDYVRFLKSGIANVIAFMEFRKSDRFADWWHGRKRSSRYVSYECQISPEGVLSGCQR